MLLEKQAEEIYRTQLDSRCDDKGTAYYFSAENFDGLLKKPYKFTSRKGDKLCGCFYSYPNRPEAKEGRLVIFDHGMGGGHRSYFKEIELLARRGFEVFAYDHTGCMESEGSGTHGFGQSLEDLDDCIGALKADEEYRRRDISVIGHSWGAYACLNIAALRPRVSHIVAISGFVSVDAALSGIFPPPLGFLRRKFFQIETAAHLATVNLSAEQSLKSTSAQVLVIHSKDDPTVSIKRHFYPLKATLAGRENVTFYEVDGKRHNPNYTRAAVEYLGEYLKTLKEKTKRGEFSDEEKRREFVASWDWDKMTEQDTDVWERIFKTLEA